MKKVLVVLAVAFMGTFSSQAQVKLGLGLGYAVPMGDIADFTDGGLAAHFELGYGVTENIDVSFLYTGDFLAGASQTQDLGGVTVTTDVGAVAVGSYMLNGRYYFKEDGFRPYGSLGLGLATVGAISAEDDTADAGVSSNFALRPAVGFNYGVLNVQAAYLNAGKAGEIAVSDLSFNIGLLFTFGGK